MVEHAVQNQTHSLTSRVLPQAQQGFITAKLFINVAIIFGVVFVHAGCFEYRIKIQRGHAQFFQIRQFLADPIEVAAVKRRSARLSGQRLIPRFTNNVVRCGVMVIDLILLRRPRFAARKPVGKDLVKDLIVNPLRTLVRIIDGELFHSRRRAMAKSLRGEPQLAVIPQQLKAVTAARLAGA
ncbi:hypothetical protein D3C72_1504420 [compost metagenome]